MRQYIRDKTAGACYFFTLTLQNRQSNLLTEKIDAIREAYRFTKQHAPFILHGMVVLPDHIHLLITLPELDDNYAARVSMFKSAFSRQIPRDEPISTSRDSKRERGIWQRRFFEHRIRDEFDFETHMHYIHYNPVKHGYVQQPIDWPYSTFHYLVTHGIYNADWGGTSLTFAPDNFGE